jgi:hypothetical protein
MLPDTGIDDIKKQRNAEYAKHINDPVLSSLKMEDIRSLFKFYAQYQSCPPNMQSCETFFTYHRIVHRNWISNTTITTTTNNTVKPTYNIMLCHTVSIASGILWYQIILMFTGPCIVIIFQYIIPTRCTSNRVYLIWQLLYMFRASLSPIFRSTKQL